MNDKDRTPNSSTLREAAYKARTKSAEASGIREVNTGMIRRKHKTGKPIVHPGMEKSKKDHPIGDTAVMPERYPDESFEDYSWRVRTGAL